MKNDTYTVYTLNKNLYTSFSIIIKSINVYNRDNFFCNILFVYFFHVDKSILLEVDK